MNLHKNCHKRSDIGRHYVPPPTPHQGIAKKAYLHPLQLYSGLRSRDHGVFALHSKGPRFEYRWLLLIYFSTFGVNSLSIHLEYLHFFIIKIHLNTKKGIVDILKLCLLSDRKWNVLTSNFYVQRQFDMTRHLPSHFHYIGKRVLSCFASHMSMHLKLSGF